VRHSVATRLPEGGHGLGTVCQRFWKNEFVKQHATPEDVREFVLSQLLAAKARVESWSSGDLEPTRAQHLRAA